MEKKSYSSARPDISFDIDGEEFTAKKIPGGLFIDFTRRSGSASEEEMADMLYDAFSSSMDPDVFERFWKHCTTDLDLETMVQIFQDLTRASTAPVERPTKPSSPSAAGRRRGAAGEGSSARVRPLKNSTSASSAT